jgi:flagellar motility protein MotE (MotC chaperone)
MTDFVKRAALGSLAAMTLLASGFAGTALTPGQAFAQSGGSNADPSAISQDIEAYCTNIADEARDRRYLIQRQELEVLQSDIDERIALLEDRRAEYEDWLKRRNDFLNRAEAGLVDIYKGMRADAAAERLQLVDPSIAAAILMKLNPRMASQILNEMDRTVAATLTGVIASAADETTSRNPS